MAILHQEDAMPRYVIERNLPPGLSDADIDAAARRAVAVNSTLPGVRWIHSNLAIDRSKFFCEYEAPSEEAIRDAARLAEIPCDVVTEVREVHPDVYTIAGW
ncbi:MAG: DUF4242 domain-containing protein [Armatimonadetes bacterium]|nr:DUF4242 domain-containing protein [Armatimonadota bacterium]